MSEQSKAERFPQINAAWKEFLMARFLFDADPHGDTIKNVEHWNRQVWLAIAEETRDVNPSLIGDVLRGNYDSFVSSRQLWIKAQFIDQDAVKDTALPSVIRNNDDGQWLLYPEHCPPRFGKYRVILIDANGKQDGALDSWATGTCEWGYHEGRVRYFYVPRATWEES